MTNSNSGDLVQQTRAETDATAEGVFARHRVRFVTRTHLAHGFVCSCGGTFPYLGDQLRKHFYDRIGEAAEAMGAIPHPSWGGFAKPETDAPAGSPDWTGFFGSEKSAQAVALIADLAGLLKSDSYPAHVGTATLARAEAFLEHGDEAFRDVDPAPGERITNEQFDAMLPPGSRDPGSAIGGAFEDAEINHQTMQEILINAIDAFEGFEKFAVGFLAGKGFDEPEVSLQHMIFGAQS